MDKSANLFLLVFFISRKNHAPAEGASAGDTLPGTLEYAQKKSPTIFVDSDLFTSASRDSSTSGSEKVISPWYSSGTSNPSIGPDSEAMLQ